MTDEAFLEEDGDDLPTVLRQRIATRLRVLGLTPITAATKAELPRDTIRNLFRQGNSLPRIDTLMSIATALETTVAYLTGEVTFPGNVFDDETRQAAEHAMNTAKPVSVMGVTSKPAPWPHVTGDELGLISLNVPGFEDVALSALVIGADDHSMEPQYEPHDFVVWASGLEVGLRDEDDVILVRETEQKGLFEWAVRRLLMERGPGGAHEGVLVALANDDNDIGDADPYPPIAFREGKNTDGWGVMGVVVAKVAFYVRRPAMTTFPSITPPPPQRSKTT